MTGLTEWEDLIFKLEQELKSVKLERDGFKEALASLHMIPVNGYPVLISELDLGLLGTEHTETFYNKIVKPIKIDLGMDVQKVEE